MLSLKLSKVWRWNSLHGACSDLDLTILSGRQGHLGKKKPPSFFFYLYLPPPVAITAAKRLSGKNQKNNYFTPLLFFWQQKRIQFFNQKIKGIFFLSEKQIKNLKFNCKLNFKINLLYFSDQVSQNLLRISLFGNISVTRQDFSTI